MISDTKFDPGLDRWSFFQTMEEELKAVRQRISRKLDRLTLIERRAWTDAHFQRLMYSVREAELAAHKAAGEKPQGESMHA